MKRKKCLAALTAAGVISAMALGMAVTSYAADGWTKTNDHWTYINQGKTHTGWLQTSEGYYYMDLSTGYMTTGFKQIDGKWKNDLDPYVAIHRVAISDEYRGMHLASYLMSSLISMHYAEGIRNYRVDTFRTNDVVRHIVEDAGFVKRGNIKNMDPIDSYRVAFELNL